jgi:hypothetical protein
VSGAFGIVGTMDGVRVTGAALDLATLVRSIPPEIRSKPGSIPVGPIVEAEAAWGNACCRGACCFIFASQHSASTLLVFLVVLATIEDKNYFTFKWLWQQAAIGQGHQGIYS